MLDKTFDPAEAEPRVYAAWEKSGAFEPGAKGRKRAPTFSMVIPPPNVTGSLHIGHALNNTLQDVLARFHRMRGADVLWQPGMDHAGIATQMVVERQLAETSDMRRQDMGRAAFLERVWEWKGESGGMILNQLKRLGASCAWKRERFTMDEGLSAAVAKVFVQLYRDGLIYRDQRLVNWDPKFQTAISDLEVENIESAGRFWHFAYPLADGPVDGVEEIVVATTRPETMLGDTAVAVHPDDERYAKLIGRFVRLPVANAIIPIVADEHADPEQGSGAVKITPAHDFNDFEVGKRHDLAMINIFDEQGRLLETAAQAANTSHLPPTKSGVVALSEETDADDLGAAAIARIPEGMRGLDRFEARKAIVARMEDLGLLREVEEKTISVPYGDRSGVVVEPRLTDQWYVDAATLAEPAIAAVKDGRTRFVPENYANDYFRWMENIQPWCVSRQLWWGHQIPAWYGPEGAVFVAESAEDAVKQASEYYADDVEELRDGQEPEVGVRYIKRDEDVLDTWFSSALWPFSTMGWPEETKELKRFYPTSVVVTAFDIIFFWVARMMMQGLQFMGDVPFREVYIHALVRDEAGQKMSKSKGNVLDPLDFVDGCALEDLIEKRLKGLNRPEDAKRVEEATRKQFPNGIERCGADALRFTLAAMSAQGRDIRLSAERILGYRNFGTKVWNAARLLQGNGVEPVPGWDPSSARETVNRWIITEIVDTTRKVTAELEAYRFNEAAGAVYRFAWNVFCDWYLEAIKPLLDVADDGEPNEAAEETRACAAWAFDQLLTLLHPFSPFITEELWAKTAGEAGRDSLLLVAPWPDLGDDLRDEDAVAEMDWMVRLVSEIRSVRAEMNVPPKARLAVRLFDASKTTRTRLKAREGDIKRLARCKDVKVGRKEIDGAVQTVVDEARVVLALKGHIDLDAEATRLAGEIAKVDGEIARLDKKLSNEKFVSRAPAEVVAAEREKQADYTAQKSKLETALGRVREMA